MNCCYAYDSQSRRVAITDLVSGTTNQFAYDGWNLVREGQTAGGEAALRCFVWGLDLSGTPQGAGGIGGLLALSVVDAGGATLAVAHYAFDGNGNVTDFVGEDNGQPAAAHYDYDPFGRLLAATGAPDWQALNPFHFSTKYLDEETGLYYYGYRWYDPELGRWLSRDPIGERGGENIYVSILNSLIDQVDHYGLVGGFGAPLDMVDSSGFPRYPGANQHIPGMPPWGSVEPYIPQGRDLQWWYDMYVKYGRFEQRLPLEFLHRYIFSEGDRVLSLNEFVNEVHPQGSIFSRMAQTICSEYQPNCRKTCAGTALRGNVFVSEGSTGSEQEMAGIGEVDSETSK